MEKRTRKAAGPDLFGMAFEFAGYLLMPAGLGYLIDVKVLENRFPYLLIVGLVAGFVGGVLSLYRKAVSMGKDVGIGPWESKAKETRDPDEIRTELDALGKRIDQAVEDARRRSGAKRRDGGADGGEEG